MKPSVKSNFATPPMKWAGGKRSLLPTILEHVPSSFGTYYEPFVGGGAVFFELQNGIAGFKRAVLNDTNVRLMQTYTVIRDNPEALIRRLRLCKNTEAYFLRMRARNLERDSHLSIATWMLYLNRTCFNGLYRVNLKGQFNTPFGHYANPTICNAPNLRAVATALKSAKLKCMDFERVTASAKAGDLVYCDPPYMPRTGQEFVSYGPERFGLQDHIRLRDMALRLKARGVHVMISNSGATEVREMYKSGFKLHEVRGARTIGATEIRRGHVPDLLIC